MSEQTDSTLAVTLTIGQLKQLIRDEVKRAALHNGDREPNKLLLYNTKEAARLLSVPQTWLGRAAREGIIECVRLGHYVSFSPENLKAFIEKRGKKS